MGSGGSSRSDLLTGAIDRKRINEALDKHLKKTSPSTSKGKDSNPSTSTAKSHLPDQSETDSEEEGSEVSGSEGDDDTSWISWFCSLRGNEFFCEVDEDYVQDDFNLCGLSGQVPYYDYALDLILDVESSNSKWWTKVHSYKATSFNNFFFILFELGDMFTEEQNELVESAAEMLYGLIHVRYILTTKGMAAMVNETRVLLCYVIWSLWMTLNLSL